MTNEKYYAVYQRTKLIGTSKGSSDNIRQDTSLIEQQLDLPNLELVPISQIVYLQINERYKFHTHPQIAEKQEGNL